MTCAKCGGGFGSGGSCQWCGVTARDPSAVMAALDRANGEREVIKRWQADHDDEMHAMEAFAQGAVLLFVVAVVAAVLLIRGVWL